MNRIAAMNLGAKVRFRFEASVPSESEDRFSYSSKEDDVLLTCNNSVAQTRSTGGKEIVAEEFEDSTSVFKRGSFKISKGEMQEATNELALQGTFKEIFQIAIYRRNLLLMIFIWSFGAFSFFVVPYYIGTLTLNIYMMSTALAGGEIISSMICLFVTHGRDKRKSVAFFMLITC
jgi:Na+/melibiose symporter-like transporter